MNIKKMNRVMVGMVSLTMISGGLFVYDNFVLAKDAELQSIYVAKSAIPANTELRLDMFEVREVPEAGVLPGYVVNINEIVGKRLRGGLLQAEPLTTQRLTTEKDLSESLEIKLVRSDDSIPVKNEDYINVYIVMNVNKEVKVQKVFEAKQVSTSLPVGDESPPLTIKVTEDELVKYYDAVERGKIIVVKNTSLDAGSELSEYDPNSAEAQAATPPGENSGAGFITKEIEEGDTLNTLAVEYKTDVESIKALNDGKSEFKVGETITLPSNN